MTTADELRAQAAALLTKAAGLETPMTNDAIHKLFVERRFDEIEQARKDGRISYTSSSTGVVRVHPAVVEHRQLAATVPRVLAAIIVGDSTAGTGKHPAKVRAARARWDRRDQLRETQARRQAGA